MKVRDDLGRARAARALLQAYAVLAPAEADAQRRKAARDRAADCALAAAARALALVQAARAPRGRTGGATLGATSRGGRYGTYTAPPEYFKALTNLRRAALLSADMERTRR